MSTACSIVLIGLNDVDQVKRAIWGGGELKLVLQTSLVQLSVL